MLVEQRLRSANLSVVLGLVIVIGANAVVVATKLAVRAAIPPVTWLIMGLCVVFLLFFFVASLSIVVRVVQVEGDRRLEILYGPGGRMRQTFHSSDVEHASAQRLSALRMGGWGYRGSLRLFRRAALVTRGGDALLLELTGHRRFWVTVDSPGRFAEYPRRINGSTRLGTAKIANEGTSVSDRKTIGIFVFEQMEELDAVGPWEVLRYWTLYFPDDGFDVLTFSSDGETVCCAKGMRIESDRSFGELGPLEVLLYPGGQGTREHLKDEAHLEWVRARRVATPLMTSVCTGSLVFAAAGLLANRRATTHWASLDLLHEIDPSITVESEARFVDDGDVVTSSGVSAGIDMALHLVARLSSRERARQVRRGIQYDPEPPV